MKTTSLSYFKNYANRLSLGLLGGFSLLAVGTSQAQQISGAGATFSAPIIQRWAVEYNKLNPKVQVNYQSIGSGAGVKNFIQGVIDFAGSDAAMTDEEIAKVKTGVVMIPATAGMIVLAYNLPGVKNLNLSREAMSAIFLGKITNWSDHLITKENPGETLPNLPINVAYRSDGSGTTYVFTQHLDAISPDFHTAVGMGKAVTFPVGSGGKGNEGVTAIIKSSVGAIGYIEYGYAENNKLAMANLQNKAGKFIAPTPESGAETLSHVVFPDNLRIWPVDPEGAKDYPIATFTWICLNKTYPDADKLTALKEWMTYSLTTGQGFANELGYIPLPAPVVVKCQAALSTITSSK